MNIPHLKRRNIAGISANGKRPLLFLILGILALFGSIGIIIFLPPGYAVNFDAFSLSIIPLLFLLTGLSVFLLVTYTFKNPKHGILAALFVLAYFWLRLNKLFHPLFAVLLVALFMTLELLFSARKEK